jgi:hypothetical protein
MRYVFNPSSEDITVEHDKLGDNYKSFTLKAGAIEEFEDHIADLFVSKLSNRMLWENYPKDRNRDKRLQELREMIEVNGLSQD